MFCPFYTPKCVWLRVIEICWVNIQNGTTTQTTRLVKVKKRTRTIEHEDTHLTRLRSFIFIFHPFLFFFLFSFFFFFFSSSHFDHFFLLLNCIASGITDFQFISVPDVRFERAAALGCLHLWRPWPCEAPRKWSGCQYQLGRSWIQPNILLQSLWSPQSCCGGVLAQTTEPWCEQSQ